MLPEYDISIWIDGNIIIRGSVLEFMRKFSNFTDLKKYKNTLSVYDP